MHAPRLLVTAGPTQEPIDEVRYLSNRSSGRLGVAIAMAGVRRGWPTTLLLGPVGEVAGGVVDALRDGLVRFRSAADLERRLAERWPDHDVLVMAAAVADWRPVAISSGKLRRETGTVPHLALEPVPDLLAGLAPVTRPEQVIVGFALEPRDSMIDSARAKLVRKRVSAVVANPLETMDAPTIEPTLVHRDGSLEIPTPPCLEKPAFAEWLLDRCLAMHDATGSHFDVDR